MILIVTQRVITCVLLLSTLPSVLPAGTASAVRRVTPGAAVNTLCIGSIPQAPSAGPAARNHQHAKINQRLVQSPSTNYILIWIFLKTHHIKKRKATSVYGILCYGVRKYNILSTGSLNSMCAHGGMWQEVTQHDETQHQAFKRNSSASEKCR